MIGPNHERHCLNGFASDALNHLHGGVDGQIFGRLKILRFEAFQVAGCGVQLTLLFLFLCLPGFRILGGAVIPGIFFGRCSCSFFFR
jgi:hypothetical protein